MADIERIPGKEVYLAAAAAYKARFPQMRMTEDECLWMATDPPFRAAVDEAFMAGYSRGRGEMEET